MNFETFLDTLPEYGVDIKLNTKNLIASSVLTPSQKGIIFLATAFGAKNKALFAIAQETFADLTEVEINAAKIVGTLMSMNNVYYRFLHLVENDEYSKMPAGLRMNSLSPSKHGIEVVDFELASIAVSAINGCGMCIASHEKTLKKHGVEAAKIQEAAKIAATINALDALMKNA